MSSPSETSPSNSVGKGATFTYVLGVFAVFAVGLSFFQAWKGGSPPDARGLERIANTAEIKKAQGELIAKMGVEDKDKAAALFEKTAAALKAKAPAPSKMVVPGSPTQLKMIPPPVPAAPAAKPAAAPVPATK